MHGGSNVVCDIYLTEKRMKQNQLFTGMSPLSFQGSDGQNGGNGVDGSVGDPVSSTKMTLKSRSQTAMSAHQKMLFF